MNKNNPDNHTPTERTNASKSSMEDDRLVRAAARGDEKAFAQLVEKYQKALFYHLIKMVRDREQVEDLTQEIFVKVYANMETYNTGYAFSTWLYRIATNHTIDYLRKKKLQTMSIDDTVKTRDGEVETQIPDKGFETDRLIIRKQRSKILHEAICNLPEKYREVIEMRHMEEKSYQEISELLGLPLGTVKAHIFRAREMLYKALIDKKEHF